MSKIRGRICYTYRLKEHLSQDCLNGNKHEPKLVNSASNVYDNSNSLFDSRKVISSPSARAIWVPKFLLTNLKGPNETWGTKTCLKDCKWIEMHWELDFDIVSNMKGYMNIVIQWHLKARWVLNHDLVSNVYFKSYISCKKSCSMLRDE
jgi:hypothetical protein